MWMLVRANALGTETQPDRRTRTLAACPDSAERGDPWRWTISLADPAVADSAEAGAGAPGSMEPGAVAVSADPEHIRTKTQQYGDGYTGLLHRPAGTQLVIAGLAGEALVAAADGPWERWLRPGDVFVVEGEDDESLRLSLPAGLARVEVVTLAPVRAHALRWVP